MKPTKGPWKGLQGANCHLFDMRIENESGLPVAFCDLEDAALIAESGTVYHETGLTPREILAQRDELRTALSGLIANFKANGGKGLGLGPVQIAKTALKNTTPEPQP